MLLGSFLEEYNQRKGEKNAFRTICQENGISYKKLPELLRSFNYEYDQTEKEWRYMADAPQPLDIDLLQAIPARTSPAKKAQQTHSTGTTQKAQTQAAAAQEENAGAPQLLANDQLFDIVLLLQQINKKIPDLKVQQPIFDPVEIDPEAAPLALQLHRINQKTKARKTLNISQDAAGWLDSFSETKGHKIGDLVSLAVMQLQKRIDPAYKAKE